MHHIIEERRQRSLQYSEEHTKNINVRKSCSSVQKHWTKSSKLWKRVARVQKHKLVEESSHHSIKATKSKEDWCIRTTIIRISTKRHLGEQSLVDIPWQIQEDV